MRPARANFRAFTLLEILIVLAIIAILVGMVAPNLRAFARGRTISDEARQIVAMARYAEAQSIADAAPYRLNIDSDGVWLTTQAAGTWAPPPNDFSAKMDLQQGITIDCDIAKQPDGQYITFSPTGRTQPSTITLADPSGQRVVIQCQSATDLYEIASDGGGR